MTATHTAHSLARRLRLALGLTVDPTYRAALVVANDHGLITGRSRTRYDLPVMAAAETILCSSLAGSGLSRDPRAVLDGVRATGLARYLAALFLDRSALTKAELHVDGTGAATVRVGGKVHEFGGPLPDGRVLRLTGALLAEVVGV